MRTRFVSLAAAVAMTSLCGLAAAAPASAVTTPDGALQVTPSAVTAGAATTVTVVGSWSMTDTIDDIVMTMPPALVNAGAVWSTASLSVDQSGPCDLSAPTSPEEAACLWRPSTPTGPYSTTMTAVLQLPAGVAPGAYDIAARAGGETAPGRTVTLTVSAPTTPTPTAAPTSAPSASASSVAVPTAVPAGEGPLSGSGGLPLIPLVVALALLGGGVWVLVRGRA
jgi:hypothetical protein